MSATSFSTSTGTDLRQARATDGGIEAWAPGVAETAAADRLLARAHGCRVLLAVGVGDAVTVTFLGRHGTRAYAPVPKPRRKQLKVVDGRMLRRDRTGDPA